MGRRTVLGDGPCWGALPRTEKQQKAERAGAKPAGVLPVPGASGRPAVRRRIRWYWRVDAGFPEVHKRCWMRLY